MGYVTYCTLCLVTDVKIYKMNSVMYTTYNELIKTQNKMSIDQMYACYECAHLLHKYKEFKEKCCNAYNLLQLYSDNFKITEENLKKIDRKQNKLKSKLTPYRDFLIYHMFEKKEKSNLNSKMPNFHENVSASKLKTDFVSNCGEGIYDEYNFNTPLTYLENAGNLLVNPLEIDEKHIKQEEDDSINNEEAIVTSNNIEVGFDLHDKSLNEFSTENNVETFKIEIESENNNECYIEEDLESESEIENDYNIEKDSNCSESSKEDDNSDEDSDVIDSMILLDSDDEDDKVNKDKIDKISEELNNLLDKYRPMNPKELILKNIEWESKELTLLQKRKLLIKDNIDKKLAKKRKTKREITSKMLHTIDEIVEIKLPSHVITKNKSRKRSTNNNKKRSSELDRSLFENYATIIELTPEDAMQEVLLRKETVNYKSCKYKCEYCFRGFNLETTYQTHMKKHSLEEGPIKCDICQIRFLYKKGVRSHMKSCHTYKFICLKCPYVCFAPTQIRAHIFQHKGKKYSCNECGESYRYPHSVLSHQRKKHKLEVVCDLCGNVYALEKGLMAHKRRIHKNEKNELQGPRCEECNVHFSNELAFKRHLVLCTKHTVSNGCEVCGEIFDDRRELREHSKQHERYRSYNALYKSKIIQKEKIIEQCNYCNIPLSTTAHYNRHMLQSHPGTEAAEAIRAEQCIRWVCEVCGAMFDKECKLTIHQRAHSTEKPFSCNKCGKNFKSAQWLRTHEATHTKVMPHKCHICGKGFGSKCTLNRHVKYHKAGSVKCTFCDKLFTYLCEMKIHVKYVHDKVPWPKRDRSKRNLKEKDFSD